MCWKQRAHVDEHDGDEGEDHQVHRGARERLA